VGYKPTSSGRRASRVDRHIIHNSAHDSIYDFDSYYDHDDAPPRVVRTIIRDSSNTQRPVLTKTSYTEWSSMMKVKLKAR
jgi:hypothetical protein